ncbi:single-stranded DNA-binding protein [Clostridium sp.]|uniref:single-stranded DNA-binding protein n=1 Tax=Clostridium sp. TaxID=1506 RepID=UPI001B7C1EDD|nr:single-stranded DNA-binding protein [Clostridium sp.]MBP3916748.1 single-stranded DNA-binding protein [Clostridium sp.]
MNHCVLIGRLTKDPELKYVPGNGTAVTTITLAVDNYNSKTQQHNADFIPVVIWGKQAENAAQYLSKGSMIAVTGRISVRNYDGNDGKKHYVTEIIAAPVNGIKYLNKVNSSQQVVNGDTFSPDSFGDMSPVDDTEMPF